MAATRLSQSACTALPVFVKQQLRCLSTKRNILSPGTASHLLPGLFLCSRFPTLKRSEHDIKFFLLLLFINKHSPWVSRLPWLMYLRCPYATTQKTSRGRARPRSRLEKPAATCAATSPALVLSERRWLAESRRARRNRCDVTRGRTSRRCACERARARLKCTVFPLRQLRTEFINMSRKIH